MATTTLTPHELNHDFAWADHAGPFRCLTEEQAEQYDRDGFTVIRGAFPPTSSEPVVAAIDALEAELEAVLREPNGGKHFIYRADEITFTTHLVTRSEVVRDFVAAPLLLDLAHDICGPDVRFYWDQAVYKKPGTDVTVPVAPGQRLRLRRAPAVPHVLDPPHRGHPDERLPVGRARPPPAGHLPPRAHRSRLRLPRRRGRHRRRAGPRGGEAGDIVVLSSLTPHCTGANDTADVRKTYIAQYAPEGGVVVKREGDGSLSRTPAADPERQFPLLVGGAPVAVAPLDR